MRLKVFQAPNAGAAMAMIREELGPDALIVASRSVDDGVEITAACEVAAAADDDPAPSPVPSPPSASGTADLAWHGVPDTLATALDPADLAASLATAFRFGELPCTHGAKPLLVAGPPGAGKTVTVARLATRLKRAGRSSLVITADGRRAGAAEQLAAFTRLLGLTLVVADTPAQLARALSRREGDMPVIVDLPGMAPTDPADAAFLRDAARVSGGEIALVLPGGLDVAEAGELGSSFQSLGARHLVATRLDQSRRLGFVLAAAHAGLVLTEAGISPSVADGACPITADFLAERMARSSPPVKPPTPAPVIRPIPLALLARKLPSTARQTP